MSATLRLAWVLRMEGKYAALAAQALAEHDQLKARVEELEKRLKRDGYVMPGQVSDGT